MNLKMTLTITAVKIVQKVATQFALRACHRPLQPVGGSEINHLSGRLQACVAMHYDALLEKLDIGNFHLFLRHKICGLTSTKYATHRFILNLNYSTVHCYIFFLSITSHSSDTGAFFYLW